MNLGLAALVSVAVLASNAQAVQITSDHDKAVKALEETAPLLLDRLASLPIEFAVLAVVSSYANEPLTPVPVSLPKASLELILKEKHAFWSKVASGLAGSRQARLDDIQIANHDLQEAISQSEPVEVIAALSKELVIAQNRRLLLDNQEAAVALVLKDIAEDGQLIDGKVGGAERLAKKITYLQDINRKLTRKS